MPVKIGRDYIDETLKSLYSLLGIHENLSPKEVYRWINREEINKANKVITEHIGIPNPVYVEFVKGEELLSFSLTERENPSFITAQIEIPHNLPIYGDPMLKNIPIRIKLNDELRNKPKEIIGGILAHENTHLILNLLHYQERKKEIDTDLASIVLGLGDLMKKGKSYIDIHFNLLYTEYRTEIFGYLDEESFEYAYKKVKTDYDVYNEWKLNILKKIEKAQKLINRNKKIYNRFQKNHNWIIQNLNSVRVKPNDSRKFVEMESFIFQHVGFNNALTQKNDIFKQLFEKVINKKIYLPDEDYNFILETNRIFNVHFKEIESYRNLLKNWLKIQLKYVKFIQKILTITDLIKN